MPLGWESSTKYMYAVKSAKFEGEAELGVENPRAPHPLYVTLNVSMLTWYLRCMVAMIGLFVNCPDA